MSIRLTSWWSWLTITLTSKMPAQRAHPAASPRHHWGARGLAKLNAHPGSGNRRRPRGETHLLMSSKSSTAQSDTTADMTNVAGSDAPGVQLFQASDSGSTLAVGAPQITPGSVFG